MKLTICFLLVCALVYASATGQSVNITNGTDGNLRNVLEMLLVKLDALDRKLLKLQGEVSKHHAEVARNMSVLQDRSLAILDLDRLRENLFDQIPKQNGSSCEALERTLLSFRSSISPSSPTFASCKDAPVNASGVYTIRVNNTSAPFKVYCEMTKFGGGWIVMQHRFNGSVDFNRNWADYRDGFGKLNGEFWLGLEHIHQLTVARTHELIVELEDFYGHYGYARYSAFQVGSESVKYSLKTVGSYSGTAGDSLTDYVGKKFSTKDQDNDDIPSENYAVSYEGAWWHHGTYSNLNGRYQNVDDFNSNWWFTLRNDIRGMIFSRMMLREL